MLTVASLKHGLRPLVLRLQGARVLSDVDPRLSASRLLTFDAFDTLITRIVRRPIDVFVICGHRLRADQRTNFDAMRWRDHRAQVEEKLARSAFPQEVRLDEIYNTLVAEGQLRPEHRDVAMQLERDIEREVSRPIAATIKALNLRIATGGDVRVISDTYLPQEDLTALLRQAGLKLCRDHIHASSQSGATKRGGKLFAEVLKAAQQTGTATHVGDNLESDWRRARASGFAAAPFLDGAPNRYERLLSDCLHSNENVASAMAGAARATRLAHAFPDQHRQTVWNSSANVTGPLLFSFVSWILAQARERGLRTLYFLSRDGEILIRIARDICKAFDLSIECRYLYVSRRSLHLPGVVTLGPIERDWVLEDLEERSLTSFLSRLDLEASDLLPLLPAASPLHTAAGEAPLTNSQADALRTALDQPEVASLVLDRAARRRALCLDYLRQEGMLAEGAIGIVDIGWKGRLQRSLCQVVQTEVPDFPKRLHGFYIDLDRRPEGIGSLSTFATLCRPDGFRWASRGALFEVFCAANHGTVTGYERTGDGRMMPSLATPDNIQASNWGLLLQQEAVSLFAADAALALRLLDVNHELQGKALAHAALAVIRVFVQNPSRAEADAFGAFAHSADEQHTLYEEMAERIDLRPWKFAKRFTSRYRNRRISFWPEASVSRSLPPLLRGAALSLLAALPGRRG